MIKGVDNLKMSNISIEVLYFDSQGGLGKGTHFTGSSRLLQPIATCPNKPIRNRFTVQPIRRTVPKTLEGVMACITVPYVLYFMYCAYNTQSCMR